ncbi:MAG: DUF3179 domain-containing protein [Rhizobiales bacterium]|nr:DUF3179 domain-containing protein [Hyphomicrobiales bacterium]
MRAATCFVHLMTLVALSVLLGSLGPDASVAQERKPLPAYAIEQFGEPPAIPDGPLSDELQRAVRAVFVESISQGRWGPQQTGALQEIAKSGDPRLAWLITDMLRFTWQAGFARELSEAAAALLGVEFEPAFDLEAISNRLIAWDVPEFPGYLAFKRSIFTSFVPGWQEIFVEGDIDWRLVSWGGVLIDNRPYDQTDVSCNCIPAADNPKVSSVEEATWLKDDDVVFGIEVNGEFRAYPRRIMEVREMVNDTLGGRHLAIPYCTLCGAAQAYLTDRMPEGIERPILRTSGLLIRSNKVMYDVNTHSVFDTFLGRAVTGPLAEKGLKLQQVSVITSDWGSWRRAHPATTVLVEALALGRNFDFRNGRDANGPIFPVGDVDPRLPVHEDVIGVVTATGTPVAFQRTTAMAALLNGATVGFENVRLVLDAGGIKAVDANGSDLGSHQAFWFAWSQFHEGTVLWTQ